MNDRESLLNEVLMLIDKYGVTAYEVEQNTTLSAVGVQKIINKETKRPLQITLETIISYIKDKYESSEGEMLKSDEKEATPPQ